MASLKNKYISSGFNYLNLAIEQAKKNIGSTGLNPSVGCVVEKNGSIISSGATDFRGSQHAEYNALNKNINFKDAKLYVSMLPCSHYGNTPPCTNIIIRKKIKVVIFSFNDPNNKSIFKTKDILINNNIKIKKKIASKVNNNFYKSYILQHSKSLPLIDAKIALTKDNYSSINNIKWITNIYSRKRVHLLRTKYNCLITTSKTVNQDDATLNCRIKGLENKSPDVFIVDRNLRIKNDLKIFKNILPRKIFVITTSKNQKKINLLKKKKIKIILLDSLNNKDDFKLLFMNIKKNYSRIFVETGLKFLNFLLKNNLVNNMYIFKSSSNAGKKGMLKTNNKILCKQKKSDKLNLNLFGDQMYKVKIK